MPISTLRICCLILVLLLSACSDRKVLAPVTELKWQPFSKNTYTVRPGDTLYAIAFRYDTDYRRVASLNHLRAPYSLRVGQVLNVRGLAGVAPVRTASYQYRTSRAQQKIIYSPTVNSRSISGWLWPVNGRLVTSFIPEQGKKGINIACKKGDKVRASSSGVVAYAGSGLAGYGNLIIIKHNNEYLTAYGNNSKNLVKEGQRVGAGQAIAEAGVVERKYWGVHFEIRRAGIPVNPLNYLQKG